MGHRLSRWLADACAIVGFYRAAPSFPKQMRDLLENDTGNVAIAATTIWEIVIKTARGKLVDIRHGGHATLTDMLQMHGFEIVPLNAETAEQATNLPPLHADPFDRALVALAQRSGRTVLTSDAMIRRYGAVVIFATRPSNRCTTLIPKTKNGTVMLGHCYNTSQSKSLLSHVLC